MRHRNSKQKSLKLTLLDRKASFFELSQTCAQTFPFAPKANADPGRRSGSHTKSGRNRRTCQHGKRRKSKVNTGKSSGRDTKEGKTVHFVHLDPAGQKYGTKCKAPSYRLRGKCGRTPVSRIPVGATTRLSLDRKRM